MACVQCFLAYALQLADSGFLLTPDQKLLKKMDEDYEARTKESHWRANFLAQNIVNMLQAQQMVPNEKYAKEAVKNEKKVPAPHPRTKITFLPGKD